MDSRLRCYTDAERPNHCRGITHILQSARAACAPLCTRRTCSDAEVACGWRVRGLHRHLTHKRSTQSASASVTGMRSGWSRSQQTHLPPDFCMQPLKYSRLKAIGSLSWVILWCVYNRQVCVKLKKKKKKILPLSRLQRGRTVWLSLDGFSLVFRWIY